MGFQKGQSGNPGGRPKALTPDGKTLSELAREHTAEAVQALVGVLRDGEASHAAIVSAATAILDRAYGRPQQSMSLELKQDEGAAAALEAARKRAAEAVALPH